MKARNVIISLFFVLALLVFTFIRVRYWEPKRKVTFKRNVIRVDYTDFALCLMDCQQINANEIAGVIRNGDVASYAIDLQKNNCPEYILKGTNKKGTGLTIFITQCGNVSKVTSCYNDNGAANCKCDGKKTRPL